MFPEESVPAAQEEAPDGAFAESTPLSGRLPLAGGILLAIVAEAFLGVALALHDGTHLILVEAGVPMISGLFALGSCLLVGMVARGRERGAWVLLGMACLGVLVAQGAQFAAQAQVSISSLPLVNVYPSVASLALIAQSVILFGAFLLFPPPVEGGARLPRSLLFFDGVLIVGTVLVGVIYFLLLPFLQASSDMLTPARLTTLGICGSDLLLLAGLTFALRAMNLRQAPLYGALCVLALAVLLLIGTDALSINQTPNHPAPASSWLQATWNAGYLGIGLGAMLRLRSGSRELSEAAAIVPDAGASFWTILPFGLVVVMAGAIVVHALTDAAMSLQTLVALVSLGLLVVLLGVRHLAVLFAARSTRAQMAQLRQDIALAVDELEQMRSSQMIQARARQESLRQLQETLARFSQGEHQTRAPALERELMPLSSSLNVLLANMEHQLNERDRGREARLLRTLSDALGRLALGEVYDLPDLPSPAGTGLEALVMGVVQIRTRLMNLQQSMQEYEAERQELEQRLALASQELDQSAQAQRQVSQEMAQTLEARLENERLMIQASEAQFQREHERMQAQLQAAEAQASAAEAALQATEDLLLKERQELQQRLNAERQIMEERLRSVPRLSPSNAAQWRKQGEQLVSQFNGQAERLHTAAATLQTAAEVVRSLARSLDETAALPELQRGAQGGVSSTASPAAPPSPATTPSKSPGQPLSAMQMLERLAGLRSGDTAPQPAVALPLAAPAPGQHSGPLGETANERVLRRLHIAATRAEEIATGLLDLAKQCIIAGEESLHAAEATQRLTADLELSASMPGASARPARAPKAGR